MYWSVAIAAVGRKVKSTANDAKMGVILMLPSRRTVFITLFW
jgi:hypothetical protein